MHRYKNRRELGQSSSKETDSIRWMGCRVAVYDLTVQLKADVRGETSGAKRGTKRRGCRRGRRNARKSRRLVTADPGSCSQHILQVGKSKRLVALRKRVDSYKEKAKATVLRCYRSYKKGGDPDYADSRRKRYRDSRRHLVDFVSRVDGDSKEFVSRVLTLYLQVSLLSFTVLPNLDQDEIAEAMDESGIDRSSWIVKDPVGIRGDPRRALEYKQMESQTVVRPSITDAKRWQCPYCGCLVYKRTPVCRNRKCGASSSRYAHLTPGEYEELRSYNRREVAKANLPWGSPSRRT